MDFARQQRDPTRHLIGIAAVILVHALVIYALVTGLARKAVEVIKKPLTATIVEEIKVPPPPPPPPPPKKIEVPKAPPPPEQPYVPPPDIPPPAPPAPPPPPAKPAVVRNPQPLNDCAPSMPGEAQRKNIEGTVVALMNVDEKGSVTDVKIKSSDNRVFDRPVLSA